MRCHVPRCLHTQGFSQQKELERHRRACHAEMFGDVTPYQCPVLNCLAAFGRPDILRRHMKLHETRDFVHSLTTDAPLQEGTVADSGYVSACVSTSINNTRISGKPKEDESVELIEAQGQQTVYQQTAYTSSVLPHDADYVSDLCNDIHMNLKQELQEHAHNRARPELSRCLPDLIKAFSIRIGLDTSNPSSGHIMHFLHAHHK